MALYQDKKELVDGTAVVAVTDGSGNTISSTGTSLNVNVTNGSSGQVADKTAFTYGTSLELTVGAVFQDTSPTVTAGSSNALRMNAQRGLHANLRNASGTEIGVSGSAVVVDGSAVTQPVSVAGSIAVTGPLTDTQLRATAVPVSGSGSFTVAQATGSNLHVQVDSSALPTGAATETTLASINSKMSPASAALSQVVLSTSSQTALAANAARKGVVMVNDSNKVIYLAFAASATTSAYSYKLSANAVFELTDHRVYTGVISVIGAASISGNLVITELS